jgi:DNA-binding MarR family transcriptional regulator
MAAPNPLFLREDELERGLELLYFAGHQLNLDATALRAQSAIDDLDHQTLFLIDRQPGITLAELSTALGVTKQTLSRHLRRLGALGLIEPATAASDRRKRPLRLTGKAAALVGEIKTLQKRRLRLAFKRAGASAVEGFARVLLDLVGEPRRELLRRWSAGAATAAAPRAGSQA